jgi:preprotein translocase subunit SecD
VVALNLLSSSPKWLTALRASPMYLGLDLRGGVHFMLQVDMQAALTKKAESLAGDLRSQMREANVRHGGIQRNGQAVEIRARDSADRGRRPGASSRTSSRTCRRPTPPTAPSTASPPRCGRRRPAACRSRRSSRTW